MPDINRVRIANIKYNDGNNIYDDFMLKLGGANTLIDMINGLGKTFFLQCMAQPMYPNAQFKPDFPVSLLFDKNNDNSTIHSLVEWRLDQDSPYRYALVGFCAYKKEKVDKGLETALEDQDEQNAFGSIKYVCYYNGPNANDIEGLPIANKRSDGTQKVMNHKELEKYLKGLQASPMRDYKVEIANYKKDHLRTLAGLNINSVEWKHLLGLNASEANAAEYLRKYRTASDFIQEFLIPIIEDSYRLRSGSDYQTESSRATTLMNLRQVLATLQKKEALEAEYTYIEAACFQLYEALETLGKHYDEKEVLLRRIAGLSQNIQSNKQLQLEAKQKLMQEIAKLKYELNESAKNYQKLLCEESAYEIKAAESALSQLINHYEKAQLSEQKAKQVVQNLEKEKLYYESEELYTEYVSYHLKKEIKVEEQQARSKGHDELMKDYQYWGNVYGSKLQHALDQVAHDYEQALLEEAELTEKKEACLLQSAHLKASYERLKKEIETEEHALSEIKEKQKERQKTFKHLTKEQLEEARLHKLALKETNQQDLLSYQKEIADLRHTLAQNEVMLEGIMSQLSYIAHELQAKQGLLAQYDADKVHYKQLMTRFDCTDLVSFLKDKLKEKRKRLNELEQCYEVESSQLKGIEVQEAVVYSKAACKQFDKIAKSYPSAKWAMTYLMKLTPSERERLIRKSPLVPYSIILDEIEYKQFVQNRGLSIQFSDTIIPVLNRCILEEALDLQIAGLSFAVRNPELILNDELKNEWVKNLKVSLAALNDEHVALSHDIEKLEQDQLWVMQYEARYVMSEIEELQKDYMSLKAKQNEWHTKEAHLTKAQKEITNRLVVLEEAYAACIEKQEPLQKEVLSLEGEWETLLSWEQDQSLMIQREDTLKMLKNQYEAETKSYTAVEESKHIYMKEHAAKQNAVRYQLKLKIAYEEQIKQFQFEGNLKLIEDDASVTLELAKEKYELYEKRLTQEAGDLQLLSEYMKEYQVQMTERETKLQQAGYSLSDFEGKTLLNGDYKAHLQGIASRLEEAKAKLLLCQQEESSARDSLMRSEGSIEHMKALFAKAYPDSSLERYQIAEAEIKQHLEALLDAKVSMAQEEKLMRQKLETLGLEQEHQVLELNSLLDKEERLNRLTVFYGLVLPQDLNDAEMICSMDTVEQETKVCLERLNQSKETYVQMLKDIIAKLDSPELVHFKGDLDELLKHIPDTQAACARYCLLIDGEQGYLEMLREEKARIAITIKALQKDEESFINQCIQKCEQVYNELMHLEELSKIDLYGHKRAMIRLMMTPLEEELRFAKMKQYINRLVEQVEKVEESKKQAYLANHLTLKELFAQFVVNIKKCDVKIFKVEDITENSRELSWHRAIGSTGQSNGMYMSIFICIISYIRQLYNPHVAADSRKFIMLDSPFSGTSAAYIWEPVIKLLDRNNVQLLCVGYDIPSHLMSLFDVKYQLTAEYDALHKQTIVVENIRSSIDLDRLSYDKLVGEQIKLI